MSNIIKSSTTLKVDHINIKIIRLEEFGSLMPMEIMQAFKGLKEKFQSSNIDQFENIVEYVKINIPQVYSVEIINPINNNSLIVEYDNPN